MSTTTAGLEDVVATNSRICDIDGKLGKLTYYGVDIHDLAEHSSFEETAYLLWHGALPTQSQLEEVKTQLCANRALPGRILDLMKLLPVTTSPMDVLRTTVSALSAFDSDLQDKSAEANYRRAIRLTAMFPSIVTSWEHIRNGREPLAPLPDNTHAANFLYMLTGKMPDDYSTHVLDVALILHADHELNASTFAARVTAGTLADMYAAITSAICALSGPLHGGANEQVIRMLMRIGEVDKSTLGENVAPLNLGYNTLFLVYALGPIIPLAVMGIARIKRFPFRGWIAICATGIILSAFPGQVFQDIGYRWILILSIPLIVAAAQGYQNLAQVPGLARGSWLRQIRLGVPLLLILTAGVYTTIETPTVPYFNLFLSYVPSSLLQNSVPLSDSASVVDALHWIGNSLPADSALITHEAFYGWAKLYLPPKSAIINSLLSSPSADLGQATQYQHVYTIWWTPGTGWFAPTFPTGSTMSATFGDIAVYEYR